jgi:GNAT superfamily N-acetyltransferase
MLEADDDRLAVVQAAVHAAFGETDDVGEPPHVDALRRGIANGTLRMAGSFEAGEAVGGGSHSPRRGVTELMGIGVVPRARRTGVGAAITAALVEDARRLRVTTVFLSAGSQRIADIYTRVGFRTVATACIAEPAS